MDRAFDHKKLEELVLCVIEKADHIGAIKLEKLLYLCDFTAAAELGQPITGEIYRHFVNGPVAKHLLPITNGMEGRDLQREKIKIGNGKTFTKYKAMRKADWSAFSEAERRLILDVLDKFGHQTSDELIKYVHQDLPWLLTKRNEEMPYFLASYRRYEKPSEAEAEAFVAAHPDYQDRLRQVFDAKTKVS